MSYWIPRLLVVLICSAIALAACSRSNDSNELEEREVGTTTVLESEESPPDSVSRLETSFDGALPPTTQLMLGILRLEDTGDAVTAAQAASMLPLWQALHSGTIQNQAERAAVFNQIEVALTDHQIEAIGAMQLTAIDLNEWAAANGVELPQFGQGGQAMQAGQGRQGGQGEPGGIFADMSEDERAAFREEMQNLSAEERRERLQEMGVEIPENAGQGGPGGFRGAGGGARFGALLEPLIELLQSKATL
ncbi:MAG: hypothetical protein OXF76_09465 [Caldilineaceae bacterium]|nr:hypothetical protein [Caldilineaceae bacterium]